MAGMCQIAMTTEKELRSAILALLQGPRVAHTFTTQWSPIWLGWATEAAIAYRLDDRLTNRIYELSDDEAYDREARYYVEPTLQKMADELILEKKLVFPHKNNVNERLKDRAYWAFRIPGYGGCCMWLPPNPSAIDSDFFDSRQVREIRSNLRESGCDELPPYMPGLLESYAKHKSGLRGLR